ncbi:MAG: hypothetical protein ACOCR1_00830 [Planctomycetota bacterium]
MANRGSKTKFVLRALLVFYPIFAGILYFTCVYMPHSQIQETKREVRELITSNQIEDAKVEMERKREEQRKQMQELIDAFRRSSRNMDLTGMPAFIGNVARETGMRFSGFTLRDQEKIHGHPFVIMDLQMEGPFDSIVKFIGRLESHSDKFVKVKTFTIEAGTDPMSRQLKMKAALLSPEGSPRQASK